MADLTKVGLFAAGCAGVVAVIVSSLAGPVWYAIGPLVIFLAYVAKLKVRKLADSPRTVMTVIAVVSVAMVAFARF